jgi:hypothetical protein
MTISSGASTPEDIRKVQMAPDKNYLGLIYKR